MMTEDLHSTIARVRIALLQSQVREKTPASPPSPMRRRRSTVTAVQSKDGVPLFTKQKTVRVVF
ncbi:hypothetical protein QBC37DRAFT_371588 [Rhypophila decipiens]|uniref:Uncharacterized protein n=1 Tax=Rhypophila decipiens TaxID=261697 RepID=A0AAN6YC77_9PEZI|nr:hypothetical protein QBC37DRAFT_371588 [Rhypophila decipiens]